MYSELLKVLYAYKAILRMPRLISTSALLSSTASASPMFASKKTLNPNAKVSVPSSTHLLKVYCSFYTVGCRFSFFCTLNLLCISFLASL